MPPNQTIIYQIPLLSVDDTDSDLAILSRDEQSRAVRYVVDRPRQQFVACRAVLRRLLAAEVGCKPSELRFSYSPLGKPSIDIVQTPLSPKGKAAAESLHFNVSHSGSWGLIALSDQVVGIDIEKLQPNIQVRSLLSQVASPEEATNWQKLPACSHAEQVLRLWVCKEALLKALGLGIAECLQQVSFALPVTHPAQFSPAQIAPAVQIHLDEPATCSMHRCLVHSNWSIQTLAIAADYFAAVAALKPNSSALDKSNSTSNIVLRVWERP